MARSRDIAIFNFSFLDIMATTIGVMIFIMVMVFISVSPEQALEALEQRIDEARPQAADAERKAQEAAQRAERQQGQAQKQRERVRQMERSSETFTARRRDDNKKLRAKINALEQKLAKAESDAAKAAERTEALKNQIKQSRQGARQEATNVEFRVPLERETTKRSTYFECDGAEVYLLSLKQSLSDNYTAKPLNVGGGSVALITRKGSAKGESLRVAMRSRSSFRRTLARLDSGKDCVQFLVRPDSFSAFRGLRKRLWAKGIDVNWFPLKQDQLIMSASGSGRGTVQ